jgi:hypothetical protein
VITSWDKNSKLAARCTTLCMFYHADVDVSDFPGSVMCVGGVSKSAT